jgi:acetyl-CoA synthetase
MPMTGGFTPLPLPGRSYSDMRRRFRWKVPERFNIGVACTDLHPSHRPAVIHVPSAGEPRTYTFGELSRLTNRVAHVLSGLGLERGDRVGVVLPQIPEAALAHLGAFKTGMVSVPLSALFGTDALQYRLSDSAAKVVVTNAEGLERLEELTDLPDLRKVLVVDGEPLPGPRVDSFWRLLDEASDSPVDTTTSAEDPCLIIYTSGTTGPPRGVLHGHRVVIGQVPGFRLCHEMIPQDGDLMWTPADWAWIGGLVNTLLLTLMHGVPIIAAPRRGFDPEWALDLMVSQGVRNTFMPTTALRMIVDGPVAHKPQLRSMLAGGEAQEAGLLEAVQAAFGITFNESYGQTEADFVVGQCASRWPVRSGSMGRAYPGHNVQIANSDGDLVEDGELGEVVIEGPNPTMLLEYWNRPDATRDKFRGSWLHTGDLARIDEEDYFWFASRADQVIKSAGYRIGPGEIEQCLIRHDDVASSAVVGAPDPVRGEVVMAYVQLRQGVQPSPELESQLRAHVKRRLAAYEYPRLLEFVESLPLTATGKVNRGLLREQAAEHAAALLHDR